jgi:hypothetical protein
MRSINGPDNFPKYLRTCTDVHVHPLPRPANFPQGQGLAASTNKKRAGNVMLPIDRAIEIVPDSRG